MEKVKLVVALADDDERVKQVQLISFVKLDLNYLLTGESVA
jgi:hypothetical protein